MSFLFESPVKTPKDLPTLKYYPIFDKRWSNTDQPKVSKNKYLNKRKVNSAIKATRKKSCPKRKLFNSLDQYVLDFGQKNFDAQRCKICNMIYTIGEIVDEKTHEEYHDKFVNSLKYRDWKNEDVVNTFDDGRVLRVLPDSPHYMHKKLDELFQVADIELGINIDLKNSIKPTSQYLIFVSLPSKRITGFVAAEAIKCANRLLSENPLMATTEEFPANCGVSRIWTHPNFRRKRIATRLLDTLRNVFFRDNIVPKNFLAFSDPTVVGKDFAKHYTESDKFLIYMFKHIVMENAKNCDLIYK